MNLIDRIDLQLSATDMMILSEWMVDYASEIQKHLDEQEACQSELQAGELRMSLAIRILAAFQKALPPEEDVVKLQLDALFDGARQVCCGTQRELMACK